MDLSLSLVLTFAGVIAVPLGAFMGTRRASSGRVDNSPSAELWTEGKAIREYLRAELVVRDARIAALEALLAACQLRVAQLEQRGPTP